MKKNELNQKRLKRKIDLYKRSCSYYKLINQFDLKGGKI